MPRPLKLSEEEKKAWRREQKKHSMRQKRAKLDAASIEERRQKDRERYQRKKDNGLITTIHDFPPTKQQQIRKTWREKTKIRRENEKLKKWAETKLQEHAPSSSTSSFSRIEVAAHTNLVIDALKAKNTLVSLVSKRKSPSLVSSSESFPAPTSPITSTPVSIGETSLPAEPLASVIIKKETELVATVIIKEETEPK